MNPLNTEASALLRYFWNILISIDQLANTFLGGSPDETISSRSGRYLLLPHDTWKWKVAYVLCRMLHWIDNGHCTKCIEEDEGHNDII